MVKLDNHLGCACVFQGSRKRETFLQPTWRYRAAFRHAVHN